MKYPYGVVEDVLVKVKEFIFPMDFVVMEIEEDNEVPLILGRPFMKTTRVIIDVEGKLKVGAQNDKVSFNVFDGLKYSNTGNDCLKTDTTKKANPITKKQLDLSDILEKVKHHCTSQEI